MRGLGRALRPLRGRLGRAAMALTALGALGAAPATSAEPLPADPPGDPNDAPLSHPPNLQPRPTATRWDPDYGSGWATRRRVQLTLLPSYAAVGLSFVGRPNRMFHGAGAMADVDVQLWRSLWLRVGGSVTAHPLRRRSSRNDDDEVVALANAGTLTLAGGNAGLAYALDVGRILAILDAAIGGIYIAAPPAVQDGQSGAACRDNGRCDPGLACGADNVCRETFVPTLSAGLSGEWLIRKRLTLGAAVRYYALLAQPSVYPVYLLVSARVGVRF